MDLKERMETVKGLQMTYETQGYLSTNDADYLIETFEEMEKEIESLKKKLKKANRARYNLGEGM